MGGGTGVGIGQPAETGNPSRQLQNPAVVDVVQHGFLTVVVPPPAGSIVLRFVSTIYGGSGQPKRASERLGYGRSHGTCHAHWECDVQAAGVLIRTSGRVSDAAPR